MIQNFDSFRQSEKPEFILCNPDGTELSALIVDNTRCILRYNDTSEVSFVVNEGCSDGYNLLATNRQILIDGLGYFIIDNVEEENADSHGHGTKKVNAKSCQYELSFKVVDYLSGVYPFYDSTGNFNENGDPTTFIGYVLSLAPGWTVEYVDSVLESRYRSLEVTKQTLLDVLYSTASKAYQCIFSFDFLNRTIRVDAVSSLTETESNKTDIYLSFDNLIDGIDMRETADDIKTKLFIYGQDLDIRQVNPCGTAYVVNLDYYKTLDWMQQDLIDAIDAWESNIEKYRSDYTSLLTTMRKQRAELTLLESELGTLEGEKAELDNVISVQIEQGLTSSAIQESHAKNLESLSIKENEITEKKTAIENKKTELTSTIGQMESINSICRIEDNFTEDQYRRLSSYFIEGEYSNNNYIVTDKMSAEEIQDAAQELYDEGIIVASRMAQPAFTLSVDAKAFIHMYVFKEFINQLSLGCMVYVEKNESTLYTPILLEMEFSWDDKEDFSLSFGNRFRLDDAGFTYEELLGNASNTSSTIAGTWESIVDFEKNYKDAVSSLLNNAFDVALHSIVSSSNQDIVWDASGFTCRKYDDATGTYGPEQFKIINNKIAFTDDGWNTIKTVLGKIALEDGSYKFGLAAEAIIGKLLAGNNLVITNEGGTFRIDENGVTFVAKDDDGNPLPGEDGSDKFISLEDFIRDEVAKVEVDVNKIVNTYYSIEEPYEANEGDLWYIAGDGEPAAGYEKGKLYRYNGKTWDLLQDSGITDAISAAEEAVEAVDGKITMFYTDMVPSGANEGDLWYVTGDVNGYKTNKFYRYNGTLWELIEDSDLAKAIDTATQAMALVDGKITTYYQEEKPFGEYINVVPDSSKYLECMHYEGDLWYCPSQKTTRRYTKSEYPKNPDNYVFRWDAFETEFPEELIDKIDGVASLYYQDSKPTDAKTGDIWYVTGNIDGYTKGWFYRYNGSTWDHLSDSRLDEVASLAEDAKTLADGKVTTYYQFSTPSDASTGDLWFVVQEETKTENSDGYIVGKLYRCKQETINGAIKTTWELVQDAELIQAVDKANEAKAVADGKITSYYQINEPLNCGEGDLWYVMGAGTPDAKYVKGRTYRYNSSTKTWELLEDSALADAILNVQTIVDSKITSYYQKEQPHNEIGSISPTDSSYLMYLGWEGDLWYNTSTNETKRYTQNTVSDGEYSFKWEDMLSSIPEELIDKIDGKVTLFYQATIPVDNVNDGDIWYVLESDGENPTGYAVGRFYRYNKDENSWSLIEDSSLVEALVKSEEAYQLAQDAKGLIDGKISSYYQDAKPHDEYTGLTVNSNQYNVCLQYEGDLWHNPSEKLTRRYTKISNGSTYDFLWKPFDTEIPEDIWDQIDGQKEIYTECPIDGFAVSDLWLYDGDGKQETISSPSVSNFEAPYQMINGVKTYFIKNDLLVASGNSDTYNPALWVKYNTNIDKENDKFEFHLNDDGMSLKNGEITMETGSNTVKINPTVGIQILKGATQQFYADADGNLHLAGKLEAATGIFSGEVSGGSINIGDGKFKVDNKGNLTAESGIFKGTVQASEYLDSDGEEMMSTLGKFKGKYLDLKGLTITNEDGDITFKVDANGNVSIRGDVVMGEHSYITWDDIEDDADGIISGKAGTLVEKLATGNYTPTGENTFISGKNIYSPNIIADEFGITKDSGDLLFKVYPDEEHYVNLDFNSNINAKIISYYMRYSCYTVDYSGCTKVYFGGTEVDFTGAKVYFCGSDTDPTEVDFTGATVTGLDSVKTVAVFG